MFSIKIFANEIDLENLFRDDASVYSTENNEKEKDNKKEDNEKNNTIEINNNKENDNKKQEIETTHGIKEEIVMDLEQEIVYEDKNSTKDNTFLAVVISSLLIIFTIVIGIFITAKNSKK